jgi:hypothetical protein
MNAELKRINVTKFPIECNCACHRGKCNHTSSPCHELYRYVEIWQLTLPDGQVFTFEHSYIYDSYKQYREVFNFNIDELLTQQGFKVFKYDTHRSDFYSYSERTSFVVKPIRNCFILEDVPKLISRAPWFSHTESASIYSDYLIIPPSADEAEWEVTEFGSSNVPHSYDVLEEDPDTGEKFITLAQCWGRREWWRTTRYYYYNGQLHAEEIASHWECDGSCSYDDSEGGEN